MMKFVRVFVLFACTFASDLLAQEVIMEPSFIKTKSSKNKKTLAVNLVHFNDTLTLPFIDDFSTNLLLPASGSVSDSAYTLVWQYQYFTLSQANALTNNKLSFDTSFTTVMTLTDTTITAQIASDTLRRYDYTVYPAVVLDSVPVWVNYSLVDSFNTGSFDTLFLDTIANDSAQFGLVASYKNLWLNNLVNINSNYPLNMPSIGVATLDAVDHHGFLYPQGSTATFSADSLTSKFIDLSSATGTYLSFMVQPGGIGDEPEGQDKLILLFKDNSGVWNQTWSSNDESDLESTSFKNIFVAVSDAKYLHNSFQFMFVNYASLSSIGKGWQGNADQWHLDYVILDQNRSDNDAYLQDVCFSTTPSTLINSYFNVPWTHYKNNTSLTASTSVAQVYNNSTSAVNTNYQTEISENGSPIFTDASGGSAALSSTEKKDFAQSLSGFTFSSTQNYAVNFNVRHSLISDLAGDIIPNNDTVRVVQEFGQHYAYDDGSAEAGYGLNSYEGQFALKYDLLSTSEKLTAVDIYFNNTLTQENFNVPFHIVIWNDDNGVPGDVLAQTITQFPKISDSLNTFLSYKLPEPISVTGTIYVGWQQLSAELLNIGLDKNTNSTGRMFYNVSGTWKNSSVQGTVMIRPRFGDYVFLASEELGEHEVSLYPNPVINQLVIQNFPEGGKAVIYDLFGQIVKIGDSANINVETLRKASYLIQIHYTDGSKSDVKKFIKL
ncbi:MAG: hypothetical protein ACJA0Q_001889 [Saprospiraceae bacterium]|jgi:hypothetical protein